MEQLILEFGKAGPQNIYATHPQINSLTQCHFETDVTFSFASATGSMSEYLYNFSAFICKCRSKTTQQQPGGD